MTTTTRASAKQSPGKQGIATVHERLRIAESDCERLRRELKQARVQIVSLAQALAANSAPIEAVERPAPSEPVETVETLMHRLTPKQCAVLSASLQGVEAQTIAGLMGITESTVKMHLRAARLHLRADSRGELAAICSPVLETMPDAEFSRRYTIKKTWFKEKTIPAILKEQRSSLSSHVTTAPAPAKRARKKKT